MGRTPDRILAWIEFGFILAFGAWTTFGMVHYAMVTDGTLSGLLTLLDTRWKGLLILGGILFFRSLRPSLMTMKLKTPIGDVDMGTIAVLPGTSYENPIQTGDPAGKSERAP